MDELRIEYALIIDIRPNPNNARGHPPKQVDQIAASITANGWATPILIDETGEIIAGHGRWLAARKLNLEQVPAVRLEGLTELQKRSLRLADNNADSLDLLCARRGRWGSANKRTLRFLGRGAAIARAARLALQSTKPSARAISRLEGSPEGPWW